MKQKRLRLIELSKRELSKRQMKKVKAGEGSEWCMENCGLELPPLGRESKLWLEYFL